MTQTDTHVYTGFIMPHKKQKPRPTVTVRMFADEVPKLESKRAALGVRTFAEAISKMLGGKK